MASPSELFLMSPPGPGWRLRGRANFRSDAAEQVDAEVAFVEWVGLARAIEAAGAQVLALEPDDSMTGLPYCAEAGHPVPPGAGAEPTFLLPRMWAPHRKEEHRLWGPMAQRIGFRVERPAQGLWEGQGDVAYFRGTPILFHGGRSDRQGLEAVRDHFSQDAVIVEVQQPAFHGNVALLAIDAIDTIVVCPELIVADGLELLIEKFGEECLLRISSEEARSYATNALPVGKTLLAPTVAPERLLSALQARGMTIVKLKMRELCEKAGGASRCLVCRVPADIAARLAFEPTDLDALERKRG